MSMSIIFYKKYVHVFLFLDLDFEFQVQGCLKGHKQGWTVDCFLFKMFCILRQYKQKLILIYAMAVI